MKKLLGILVMLLWSSNVYAASISDVFKALEKKTYTDKIFGIKIFDNIENYIIDKDAVEYVDLINDEFDLMQMDQCPSDNCREFPYVRIPFEYQTRKAWLLEIKWRKNKLLPTNRLIIDRKLKIEAIRGYKFFDKEKRSKFNNLEKCNSKKENLTRKILEIHKIPEQKLKNEDYSWTYPNKDNSKDIWISQDTYVSYKVDSKPVVLIIRCHYSYGDKENDPVIFTYFSYELISKRYVDFLNNQSQKGWKGERKTIDNISTIFNSENTGL